MQDGAGQLRGAPVTRDPCVLWWSGAVAPVVCGQAQQGATHHVGVMGRTMPGGQWPHKATLGVSSAEDSCPQGQQSWEQGSCSHLGARRGSLAWSRGCVTRQGPGWDAGGSASALRDSSTASADAATAPLASSLAPQPSPGRIGEGAQVKQHPGTTPGAVLPVPYTALALGEVQCE